MAATGDIEEPKKVEKEATLLPQITISVLEGCGRKGLLTCSPCATNRGHVLPEVLLARNQSTGVGKSL